MPDAAWLSLATPMSVPYAAWLSIATALSVQYARLNGDQP